MALSGGYHFPKEQANPTNERKPVKDKHSDIADSVQYAELGEGAGLAMVGRGKEAAAGQFGATAPLETEGQGLRQPNPKMAIFCQP